MDIRAVIQSQRHHTVKAMQDYTRLKAQALAGHREWAARVNGTTWPGCSSWNS